MFYILNNKKIQYDYVIEASNIAGLGAIEVVSNILKSLSLNTEFEKCNVYLRLPNIDTWKEFENHINTKWKIEFIKRHRNTYLRLIFRFLDILRAPYVIPKCKNLIVLGDFPLRLKCNQVLLLHNPHLVDNTKTNFFFNFHRLIFGLNHKYVNTCIVQTNVMENKLCAIYPFFKGKTMVILMPVSDIFIKNIKKNTLSDNKIKFFYPASFYKHKNHKILSKYIKQYHNASENVRFNLTITKDEFNTFQSFIKNNTEINFLGKINKRKVIHEYENCDALFFPSLDETYGLPLIEAMKMGKLILCVDLPYARILCENEAVYFDPQNIDSLNNGIEIVRKKIKENYVPNWSFALSKIPVSWDEYTLKFLSCI